MITKLQNAVMNYGINNPLVKKQLQALMKYQEMVPGDIRPLFELILGSTSYTLFLTKWQERLEEKMVENLDLPLGVPLKFASLEQLMGTGAFRDPARQAALHPRILAQSKAAALEAFLCLPQTGKVNPPYLKIRQEDNEPFLKFVDKVQEAVEVAPNVPQEMKDILVKEIVVQNANATCRRIIASIDPGANLVKIIEACSRAPWEEEKEQESMPRLMLQRWQLL